MPGRNLTTISAKGKHMDEKHGFLDQKAGRRSQTPTEVDDIQHLVKA